MSDKTTGFIKTFWAGIVGSVAFVGNVVTILGYLKIDPSTATDAASRIFWMCAPAISFACGCVSGWGFTRQWSDHKLKDAAEEHEKEVSEIRAAHEAEISNIRSGHEAEVSALNEKIRELEYDGMTPEKAARIIPNLVVDELSAIGWLLSRYGDGIEMGLPGHLSSVFRILVKKGIAVEAGGDTFSLSTGTVRALRSNKQLMNLVKEAMLYVSYDDRGNRHEVPQQVREEVMSETESE